MVRMQAAVSGQGSAGQAIMLRQLGRLSVALMDAHAAAGDARRAEQLAQMMREKFAAVERQLPAVQAPGEKAATARAFTPEEEKVRLATEGLAAPGTGSPVPNTITPRKRSTADTSRDRDGHGRE